MEIKKRKEPRKDCRFYNAETKKCTALNNVYCSIEEKPCSFFKPKTDERIKEYEN